MKKSTVKLNRTKHTTAAKKRAVVVVLCALLAVAVVLDVSLSWGVTKAAGNWVGGAFSSVGTFFSNIKGSVDGWFDEIANRKSVYEENQRLKEQLEQLENQVNAGEEYRRENERLRALLQMADSLECRVVAYAGVSAVSSDGLHDRITLNKGSLEGLEAGMAVATEKGLLGVVEEVFDHHAVVKLLTDVDSSVSILLQRSRITGVLTGNAKLYFNSTRLQISYLPSGAEVEEGEGVFTSGYDANIPKGLRIGTVESVTFNRSGNYYTVIVLPHVSFSGVETVMVLAKP